LNTWLRQAPVSRFHQSVHVLPRSLISPMEGLLSRPPMYAATATHRPGRWGGLSGLPRRTFRDGRSNPTSNVKIRQAPPHSWRLFLRPDLFCEAGFYLREATPAHNGSRSDCGLHGRWMFTAGSSRSRTDQGRTQCRCRPRARPNRLPTRAFDFPRSPGRPNDLNRGAAGLFQDPRPKPVSLRHSARPSCGRCRIRPRAVSFPAGNRLSAVTGRALAPGVTWPAHRGPITSCARNLESSAYWQEAPCRPIRSRFSPLSPMAELIPYYDRFGSCAASPARAGNSAAARRSKRQRLRRPVAELVSQQSAAADGALLPHSEGPRRNSGLSLVFGAAPPI